VLGIDPEISPPEIRIAGYEMKTLVGGWRFLKSRAQGKRAKDPQ
jgi:hypothetical protein